MGRGRGGYDKRQRFYRDSGGFKVTDKNASFVAERYMEMGYEVVFRRKLDPDPSLDLTIKTSNDERIVKHIEVKGIEGTNVRKIKDRIKDANKQIKEGDTIAIYLKKFKNDPTGRAFAKEGIAEAERNNLVKGSIEVWFSDETVWYYTRKE